MNLKTVRNALKAAIDQIEGLNVDDLRDGPNVPCAIVVPDMPIELDLTFDGFQEPKFVVHILVPYVATSSAQDELDDYLSTSGPKSVKAAIEKDSTLGGVVNGVHVNTVMTYGVTQMLDGGTQYLGAELIVEIYL